MDTSRESESTNSAQELVVEQQTQDDVQQPIYTSTATSPGPCGSHTVEHRALDPSRQEQQETPPAITNASTQTTPGLYTRSPMTRSSSTLSSLQLPSGPSTSGLHFGDFLPTSVRSGFNFYGQSSLSIEEQQPRHANLDEDRPLIQPRPVTELFSESTPNFIEDQDGGRAERNFLTGGLENCLQLLWDCLVHENRMCR